MNNKKMTGLLAAGLLTIASAPASAMVLTWTLSAEYEDGSTAAGTFDYDADVGASGFSAIDIMLTDSSNTMFLLDTQADCGGASRGPIGFTFATDANCAAPFIQVEDLITPLSNSGGTISIANSLQFSVVEYAAGSSTAKDGSFVTTVGVPEPASIVLLGLGLAGTVLVRRRRSAQ